MASVIDLNCDMGESYGRWTLGADEAIMPHITSANIACGFHGGDPHVIRKTVALALQHGVALGAHPSLPDLMGFGRRVMDVTAAELRDYVCYQTGAVREFCRAAGADLQHVKPHGILYTMAEQQEAIAEAIGQAARDSGEQLILMTLASGQVRRALPEDGDPGRLGGLRRPRLRGGRARWCPGASAGSLITDPDPGGGPGGEDGDGGQGADHRRRRDRRLRADHLLPRRHAGRRARSCARSARGSRPRGYQVRPLRDWLP